MSFHVHRVLDIEPIEYTSDEQIINLNNVTSRHTELTNSPLSQWSVSIELRKIMDEFDQEILTQFPCVPCSVCSKLMYPKKSMWIQRDHNITYPLTVAYPNISLVANPNPPTDRIAVCASCKTNPNRNYPPYLCQIPPEITSVPLEKRKYLSPIFLHCSLGHTSGANPFSEYRTLVGTVNYSQNLHSLNLYSGILGAYLAAPASDRSVLPPWLDNSILSAIDWLKENNPYLHEYSQMIPNTDIQFPSATHS
ncbi:3056_t:CDS:1, partial [Gigaspora rosea]